MAIDEKNIQPISPEKEPSSARLIFSLGMAGLLSGLILAGAFIVTKPIIEENKARALREAIYRVLPGCESFKTLELIQDKLILVDQEETKGKDKMEDKTEKIYLGFNGSGNVIGFAISGGEPGFQDVITGILGLDAKRERVVGFEVLESKETPGLGDKIIKDNAFKENFTQLAIKPKINVVKKGGKTQENEIEAITGATISSKAIGRLIQKSLDKWLVLIEEYESNNNPIEENGTEDSQ